MIRYKNIIILQIKKLVFLINYLNDKNEINKRLKNTYFDKIIQ